jgi:hypothetical protein
LDADERRLFPNSGTWKRAGLRPNLIVILPRSDQAPLNSPFRFSMYAEMASERSSEGTIMLDLAALYSKD